MLEEDVRDLMERLYSLAVDYDCPDPLLLQDREELLWEVEEYLGIEHGYRE